MALLLPATGAGRRGSAPQKPDRPPQTLLAAHPQPQSRHTPALPLRNNNSRQRRLLSINHPPTHPPTSSPALVPSRSATRRAAKQPRSSRRHFSRPQCGVEVANNALLARLVSHRSARARASWGRAGPLLVFAFRRRLGSTRETGFGAPVVPWVFAAGNFGGRRT